MVIDLPSYAISLCPDIALNNMDSWMLRRLFHVSLLHHGCNRSQLQCKLLQKPGVENANLSDTDLRNSTLRKAYLH